MRKMTIDRLTDDWDWKKIKAGDMVYVKDWGKSYGSNYSFFQERLSQLKYEWMIKYGYENNMYELYKDGIDRNKYKVLYVDGDMALITREYIYNMSATYLIATYALKLAPVEMTKKQIEEALGYPIEIIEEGEET